MSVAVETIINVEVEKADGAVVLLTLTLDEARALKDELIRAVGAQNPLPGPGYAQVLTPKIGWGMDRPDPKLATKIPEHLLKRAEAAREKVANDVRGDGVLHPSARPQCHCGDAGDGARMDVAVQAAATTSQDEAQEVCGAY